MSQGFARQARIGVDLHVGETLYHTSSTTFEKADYPGLYGVRVKVQAGGGGAAGNNGAATNNGSGGAGGGAYAEAVVVAADLATSETVTVGAGGTAGAISGSGGAGGDSSFGTHAVAGGGTPSTGAAGGHGGDASAGDLLISGSGGGPGLVTQPFGGTGGDSVLGGGGAGASASDPGHDGKNYGGGGSGGSRVASGGVPGGAGAPGIVIIEVLYERKIAVDEDIHTQYLNDTRHSDVHESAKASRSLTTQAISGTSSQPISFDTEHFDDNGLIDLGTNPTRITIQTAGSYLISGGMVWENLPGNGQVFCIVRKNGTDTLAVTFAPASHPGNGQTTITLIDQASVGDYYELCLSETTTTGSLNILADVRNHMSVARIT